MPDFEIGNIPPCTEETLPERTQGCFRLACNLLLCGMETSKRCSERLYSLYVLYLKDISGPGTGIPTSHTGS